ncbi:hypothetical protein [Streptomyces poonensis]|uniref:Uncharacterized protein n=1 Tax=Streptomyces poonensis TaxID=68255 RepID=A0A918Q6V9_9ACTN|nr:hypothetical protein [Streptomyces poonensis]GGZ34291.1 hypothetical protein GCM10010365_64010 [Streptomyces poonensis]GLJ89283.1 hypothetical protein GCM10017589_18830 [Streptomyces poonensis]
MPDHASTDFHEHETAVRPDDRFDVVRSDDGRWYTVTGLCPTCRATVVFRVAYGVLGPSKRLWGRDPHRPEPLTGSVTVFCQCGYPHAERPPESPDTGCGAFWDVPVSGTGAGQGAAS